MTARVASAVRGGSEQGLQNVEFRTRDYRQLSRRHGRAAPAGRNGGDVAALTPVEHMAAKPSAAALVASGGPPADRNWRCRPVAGTHPVGRRTARGNRRWSWSTSAARRPSAFSRGFLSDGQWGVHFSHQRPPVPQRTAPPVAVEQPAIGPNVRRRPGTSRRRYKRWCCVQRRHRRKGG